MPKQSDRYDGLKVVAFVLVFCLLFCGGLFGGCLLCGDWLRWVLHP